MMESVCNELYGRFEFVKPEPASEKDLELLHGRGHIESVRKRGLVYEVARLTVGGAIKAAELPWRGNPLSNFFDRRVTTPAETTAGFLLFQQYRHIQRKA